MQRNCLRRVVGTLCFLLLVLAAHAQKYTVTGGQGTPLLVDADDSQNKNQRLEVYLVYGMDNVEISYTSASTSHQWYRYKTKKLEAERIASVQNGTTSVISNLEEGYGYFVEETGLSEAYVWIIDYSKYAFDVTNLYVDTERSNCDYMALGGSVDMKDMKYYTPLGSSKILNREFDIIYQTMKQMGEDGIYTTVTVDTVINPFEKVLDPPLCDTDVTLKGDLFARHFGVEKVITTDVYQAVAVEAVMKIDTLSYASDIPNMVVKGDSLSAPVEFNFTAIANIPVAAVFKWSIFQKNEGTENTKLLEQNGNREDINYTFNQNGTYIVSLEVSDRTLQCTNILPEVTINISDTYLEVPNAFSPGTTPGINDEFRVAYRSLNSFKCWIFNRWGAEIYHWTDPSQGWDGKKGGKYVAPGVYFYVIEATGSDGKRLKKKGSINILRSKRIDDEIIEE
ncbi:gliding motility-associated C-terminal domain-containing protein [uncultured Parabacteroides sp.]|mgnify:CR=1 FL=1|uniref:T9SS type B sorting domain-containing protein n=1 Tax=uncultured Parabacteroides sp. TaxID=512312 RepID=UPI00258A5D79|nr:gliding motility-associated C-terminal domain-containing protein [uncultured Parabacteroides sp.]